MTQPATTAIAALAGALDRILAPGCVVAAADLPRSSGEHRPDLTIGASSVVSLDGAYAVPPAVPAATIDVLSPASLSLRGDLLLQAKRHELARRGVRLHLEINIHDGIITLWVPENRELVPVGSGHSLTCEALGDALIEAPGKGVLRVYSPDRVLIAEFDASAAKKAKIAGLHYDALVTPTAPGAPQGPIEATTVDVTEDALQS
jgi:hypothetical protein